MSQSRLHSAIETCVSTAIGFTISWLTTMIAFPLFGWKVNSSSAAGVTLLFTVISLLRGYFVRRLFNYLGALK